MSEPDEFIADLAALGFVVAQTDRRGVRQYARAVNRYLTEWVHDSGEDLLFTWEYAIGEYFHDMGWQLGTGETSFHILYPQFDVRLGRDIDAVGAELDRLESRLGALDLVDPAL